MMSGNLFVDLSIVRTSEGVYLLCRCSPSSVFGIKCPLYVAIIRSEHKSALAIHDCLILFFQYDWTYLSTLPGILLRLALNTCLSDSDHPLIVYCSFII